ncbi:MAG TPA: hypothetical protein PK358_16455 [Spirochaetota bacterium]|nr:hypothetical protein [Spirochaetota bacterium]HPJ36432.1 hypothetical protein [Spirochaetota bacterium]
MLNHRYVIPIISALLLTITGINPLSAEQKTENKGFLEIYCSRGFTYPSGEISGDGGQEARLSGSESAGINAGYTVSDRHIVHLGIGALNQRFEVERNYMGQEMLTSVEAKFMNFELSYRFQESWFYAGGGLYTGIPFGAWSRKNALNGTVTETLLYGSTEDAAQTTYGLLLFSGLTFDINNTLSLNTGVKFLLPVTPAYESDQDSIKIFDAAFCVAVAHKFNVPYID